VNRLLCGTALALAPLALAGTAAADGPSLTLAVKAPATARPDTVIAVKYLIKNTGNRIQRNVTLTTTVPDPETPLSMNCGPLGREVTDLESPACFYPAIPAHLRVQPIARFRICGDCLGTTTQLINAAGIADTGIGASAVTRIDTSPPPPRPAPTPLLGLGGLGITIGGGITIRIG